MRVTPLVAALLAVTLSGSVLAQEWIEFASREDRFTGNFPTQPRVTTTTYQSQYGADLPARSAQVRGMGKRAVKTMSRRPVRSTGGRQHALHPDARFAPTHYVSPSMTVCTLGN